MLVDGLKLMAVGMGAVFVFLALMVFIMMIVAKLLAPYAHVLSPPVLKKATKTGKKKVAKTDDSSIISAIVAAVHKYRDEHK